MIDQKVMEKLRKILTLAGDRAATQGEIEAAMAKAKDLAIQYNINLSDVSMEDPNAKRGFDVVNDDTFKPNTEYERVWHAWIFHVVKEVFDVRTIISKYRNGAGHSCIGRVWFVGEATDVEIAKVIFRWLEDLYPRSCRSWCNATGTKFNRAVMHGYFRGLTMGILEVNRKKEDATKSSNNAYAIVLRDKKKAVETAMEKYHPTAKQAKSRSIHVNTSAISAGYAKGHQINLNQMPSGASTNRPQIS